MTSFLEMVKAWGPMGAFLVALIDGIGLPNPGGPDYLVLFLGWAQPESAILSGFAAVAGALIGSMALYYAARKGGERYLAVSYTHLDVYKRQVSDHPGILLRKWPPFGSL